MLRGAGCAGKWVTCASKDKNLLTAASGQKQGAETLLRPGGNAYQNSLKMCLIVLAGSHWRMHTDRLSLETAGAHLLFQSGVMDSSGCLYPPVALHRSRISREVILSPFSQGPQQSPAPFPVFLQLQGLGTCSALLLEGGSPDPCIVTSSQKSGSPAHVIY